MNEKLFDLNIEEILDNWETFHAIREIIANALDEQLITGSDEIRIFKSSPGVWQIRDFGRGIRIEHFTLNENAEKLSADAPEGIIGKFGVGLKDALATFSRRGVQVLMRSRYGQFDLREAHKHDFEDIVTLHVQYNPQPIQMQGTEVILCGATDEEIQQAKSLFMAFSDEHVIEETSYGQIIEKKGDAARVYINGVLANEESNFLFSYNITSLTEAMRKRLNRERLNVGRTTYTDRVKAILKAAGSKAVQDMLADQVSLRSTGTQCDEMQWLEISQLAFNLLNKRKSVAYVTEKELYHHPEVIDNIRQDGIEPVVVNDAQKEKIDRQIETGGEPLRTVTTYRKEFNESFSFKFVEPASLTPGERRIFNLTPKIIDLVGQNAKSAPPVRISETMRLTMDNTSGVWDPSLGAIIILRSQLRDPEAYAKTLLHELVHAQTGLVDVTRSFESALSDYLGKVAIEALRRTGELNK
jgi:hypothetical protein